MVESTLVYAMHEMSTGVTPAMSIASFTSLTACSCIRTASQTFALVLLNVGEAQLRLALNAGHVPRQESCFGDVSAGGREGLPDGAMLSL